MTEQEAEAKAEAEYLYPSDRWGLAQRGAFERGAAWERARHSPEWSCPVEGCTLKPLHTHAEFEPNEWSRLVAEERAHQVEVGYDAKHDSEHGLDHLLGWAEDYLRRDRRVEAGALIRAARELAPRVVVAAPSDTDRETLARIITDMMPNVPLCCSGAAFKSEGHDQNPPCLTVIRGREIADAVLASRASQPVQVEPWKIENLEIVSGWLVERGALPPDYPAGPEHGAMPYSDAEPLVNLSEVPGWPVQVEVTDPEAQPWVAADGDTRCQKCGSRNPVWWTDADIWNALMPDDGVLCPTCFHRAWLASAALGGGE